MRTEHALRYLLLRHMEPFQAVVPRERFRRIVTSLRVEATREGFEVRWNDGEGGVQQRSFPRSAFSFYTRGDRAPVTAPLARSLANDNDTMGTAFAEEVFGCRAPALAPERAASREPYQRAALAGALALCALLLAAGLAAVPAALLAAWLLLEHLQLGRLYACAPLLALSALASPPAAVLGSLAYAALQLLDPDTRWRRLRVALCGAALLVALLRLPGSLAPFAWPLVPAAGLALGLAVQRSLYVSHFRAVPLALPFWLAGLAFGGALRTALLGLALLAAGNAALALAHRVRPLRRV